MRCQSKRIVGECVDAVGELTMDFVKRLEIEWECQKVLSQYYHPVDQREYDEAMQLMDLTFTG